MEASPTWIEPAVSSAMDNAPVSHASLDFLTCELVIGKQKRLQLAQPPQLLGDGTCTNRSPETNTDEQVGWWWVA